MVSLTRSFNTNSGGATFFSESINAEDMEQLQPILDSYGVFKPLKTIPIFSLHLLFAVALDIVAIVYAIIHPDENSKCREYFIIIYLHIGLWFFTLVLDQVVKCKHHNLRLNGYLDFYKITNLHISLPIYIVSLWTVAILFVETLMQHFYPDDFAERCVKAGTLSPISYIAAAITVEVCVVAGVNINYIVKVRKFNRQKPPPDVQKEEWITCDNPETMNPNEIGYKQLGDTVVDLLEKQADLIRHLKEHNARLGEKLMIQSAQLHHARMQQQLQRQPQQRGPSLQNSSSQEQLLQPQQQQPRPEEQLQGSQEQAHHPPQVVAPSIGGIVEIHPEPSQNSNG